MEMIIRLLKQHIGFRPSNLWLAGFFLLSFGWSLFIARTGVGPSGLLPIGFWTLETVGGGMMAGGALLCAARSWPLKIMGVLSFMPYTALTFYFFYLTNSGQAAVATAYIQASMFTLIQYEGGD